MLLNSGKELNTGLCISVDRLETVRIYLFRREQLFLELQYSTVQSSCEGKNNAYCLSGVLEIEKNEQFCVGLEKKSDHC